MNPFVEVVTKAYVKTPCFSVKSEGCGRVGSREIKIPSPTTLNYDELEKIKANQVKQLSQC